MSPHTANTARPLVQPSTALMLWTFSWVPAGPWYYFGGGLERRCGQRFPGGGAGDCDDGLRVLCAAVHVAVGGGKSGCWSADYVGRCQCRYYSLGGSSHRLASGTDNYFAVVVVVVDSFLAAF